jgi:putative oxidoreductase
VAGPEPAALATGTGLLHRAGLCADRLSKYGESRFFPAPQVTGIHPIENGGRSAMNWAETYISWQPRVLSVLRIMTGLLFLQYGMAKLLKFPAVPAFKDVTLFSLYGLAGTLELVGGALMILGLFTRPVAFILAGEMAFAYFIGHAPRGFLPILNGGNLAILFCFVFFYLSFAGAGPWSLDALRKNREEQLSGRALQD